jgi:membrane associated rhomboid family serine protease
MIPLKDDNPTTGKPTITYLIIGLCILVFLIQLSSQSYKTGQLFYSFGLVPSVLMGHNQLPTDLYKIPSLLTIFTSMFMHGGFMHLAGNMLYMWIFADNIEDNLGATNFLIFYLLAGIGAGMTQVLMDTYSQVPMVGASGAIGGVLGAYLINHPNAKVLVLIPFGFFSQLIKIRALYVLGFWFILQFISTGGGVAYAAHIGGFVSGIILILFFNKKRKKINKTVKGPWS